MRIVDRKKLIEAGYTLSMIDLFRNRIKVMNKKTESKWIVLEKFKSKQETCEAYKKLLEENETTIGIED